MSLMNFIYRENDRIDIIYKSLKKWPKEISIFVNNTTKKSQKVIYLFKDDFKAFLSDFFYNTINIPDHRQTKYLVNVKNIVTSIYYSAQSNNKIENAFEDSIENICRSVFKEINNVVE